MRGYQVMFLAGSNWLGLSIATFVCAPEGSKLGALGLLVGGLLFIGLAFCAIPRRNHQKGPEL